MTEQAVVQGVGTVLLGLLLLGLLRRFGFQTVDTSKRSPIISLCIGVPATLVVGGLFYTGLLLSGSGLGIFFAIPLVVTGVLVLPAGAALGFVSIGGLIASRFGLTQRSHWVLVGGLLSGLTALVPVIGLSLTAIALALGIGSGARVLFSGGGIWQEDERVVPPANKV
ncbi:hypothetical protein ACLI4Y_15735 [Natrialbaceae archaeon A-CW3]